MIQLQSILLPNGNICTVSELYYHKADTRIDFNGYFNLFYIEKRKIYTNLHNLRLCIRLQGYQQLILVHDGVDLQTITLEPEQNREYWIDFPYGRFQNGCFWFALVKEETTSQVHVSGYYAGEAKQEEYRQVNLCLDICTYKREGYVARNLKQLKEKLLDRGDLDVSGHMKLYIIDNGNTLMEWKPVQELAALCQDKIWIFPNKNAGGAGGFTRGMMEALKAKEKDRLTHILLMDDDAMVEPDTFVRIYGFLTMLKEKWKNITVGGAMLREDYPYLLYCSGEWWKDGTIFNPHIHMDLRKLSNAAGRALTSTGHEHDRYCGWWCCCYSLEVVREDNLPVPLFLHHDDIEYGIRNRKNGIVFLNGVGVWHKGPETVFPGPNMYYDTRNNLIEVALHQERNKKNTARKILFKALTSAVIRLNYYDLELVYRGFTDFLKGPVWLYRQEPEKLNQEIRDMSCRMYPLEELRKKLPKKEFDSVIRQIDSKILNGNTLKEGRKKKFKAPLLCLLTFNGWLLLADKTGAKVVFPADSPFILFRKKKAVLCEANGRKVYLTERDYGKLPEIIRVYIKTFFFLERDFERAVVNYQNHIPRITKRKAWEAYLNLR